MIKLRSSILHDSISLRSFLTMVIQGSARGLSILTFILIARIININYYGLIIFGNAMAKIVACIAMMGALGLMTKEWGACQLPQQAKVRKIYHLCNWYLHRGLLLIFGLICLWFLYIKYFQHHPGTDIEFLAFLYVVPLFMANLFQSFFISVKRPLTSSTILLVINIYWFLFTAYFYLGHTLTVHKLLVGILIGSSIIVLTILIKTTWQHGPYGISPKGGKMSFALAQWGSILLIQSDILILKFFTSSSQIALYGVALQLSMVVSFVLGATNSNIISHLAEDYHRLQRKDFQKNVSRYVKIIAKFSIIAILVLICAGYFVCQFYGEKYTNSYYLLCILIVGQFFNVLSGSNGWLLNLTGHEKITVYTFYFAIFLNLILGSILAHVLGATGVAISSSLSLIAWNIVLIYYCFKKLKINPTIITSIRLE